MARLAIYDMDKTITKRPTYTPFLIHAALHLAPWRLLLVPFVGLSLAAYGMKLVDRGRLKEINHALLLGRRRSKEELAPIVASFAERTLEDNLKPGARAQIAADRDAGRMLILATASYRFYARVIGERLGFDHVIGTDTILGLDLRIHAKIDGENCYGPAKLRMIEDWLAEHALVPDAVRFYSDHHSDSPVFEWADEAVAVDPDPRLAAVAKARGWRIESWA